MPINNEPLLTQHERSYCIQYIKQGERLSVLHLAVLLQLLEADFFFNSQYEMYFIFLFITIKSSVCQSSHPKHIREEDSVCFPLHRREVWQTRICKCFHLFHLVGNYFNWLIEDVYLIGCGLIIQDVICQAVQFRCNSVTVSPSSIRVNVLIFFHFWSTGRTDSSKICEGLWLR